LAADRQPRSDWLWSTTVAVILLVMELILLSALVPTDWSSHIRGLEDRWLRETMGAETAELIHALARTWYGTAVRGMLWVGLLVTIGLLVPLPVPPLAVPVLGVLLGVTVAILLTQTQKVI
jgi:hypothetical protein